MKTKFQNRFLLSSIAAVVALSSSAFAQTITKADNTTALGTGSSWTGGTAPGSGNIADWSGTYITAGSLSAALPGSVLSWQGISIGSLSGTAAGLVSIGGTGTAVTGSNLTIGTSGIDMSAANQNLVINAATTVLTGNQTWTIGAGRNLRLGITGGGAGNANVDGTATITISGSGLVDANQGGSTGFADAAGYAGFSGKWQVNSGATLRGLRNGATAWGTSTAADAITLNGGTLAVGGISGTQGSWTWNNPITLAASTNSSIDQQIFSGTGRFLKLMGAITGDATTNLIFKETGATDSFSNDDLGYIIAVDNPNLAGTVTIWGAGATENNIANRLTSVRVGGVNGATDVTTTAGAAGTLGTATVVNNGVLTLSRTDTWTFANTMSGTGSLRIGGGVTGAGTQVVSVSGNNSFSGGTILGAGTLKIGHSSALGTGALSISSSSAVFDNATGAALSIANGFALSGGSPTFTGTDDMTLSGPVTLSGITAGQTRTITVSAKNLTLSNAISEGVAGLGLTKAGTGTLILSNANSSFTGQVTLSGGQTNITKLAVTGSNSSLGAGNASYTIRLNGGTLNYAGTGGDTTDRVVQLQASGAINNNGGGSISFTAPSISHTGTASARTFTLGGSHSGGANAFDSVITDSGVGTNLTALVKNGASQWTLGAANTYTGTTTINAGTLALGASGSIANTPTITVAPGAVFDVSASSFALGGGQTLVAGRTSSPATDVIGTLASSGTINPASNGTMGTLTVNGGLSLTGGTLSFDLTSGNAVVGGGVNDHIFATGALNLSGSTTVNVIWSGTIQPGTYTLISGASLGSGDATNLVAGTGIINGGRSSFTLDTTTTPGSVLLTVSGNPLLLKWVGDGAANEWDINTTANWNNGSGSEAFMDFDYVTFDDSSSNGSVSLGVIVLPGSMTFNNSATHYTISGMGRIEGAGSLSKAGSASLTLATDNNYTGDTTLSAGTLMCGHNFAFGIGTLNLNGGTLSSDSSTARTLANPVTVGGDVILGDAVNTGSLTLNGTVSLGGSTRQLTTPSTVTLSGILSNGGLTKAGTGTLTLGAANTYSGATNVNGGTLKLSGAGTLASSSTLMVGIGGTLEYAVGGNQTVSNAITNNGSVIRTSGTNNLYFSSTANTGTGSWGCNSGYIGFNTVASMGSTTAINLDGGGVYLNTNNQIVPNTITVTLGAAGGSLNGSTGNTTTWNSKFTGSGGLAKVSGETAVLAGNNDYTGTTTLSTGTLRVSGTTNTTAGTISFNGGTLQIASGGSFTTTGGSSTTASAGSLNVNAGGTLSVGSMSWSYAPGTFAVDGALNVTGALTASWNAAKSLTGTGTINAGSFANNNFSVTTIAVNRLNLGGNITMSNPGSITLSGTTLGAFANWSSSAPMNLASATVNTVNTLDSVDGTTARSVTLSGALSGGGDLIKTGAGSLTLSGVNTYTGATTVNGGTLVMGSGGAIAGSGVIVSASGTLSGTGTVGAPVTAAGTIAPGTGVGQLPVTGNTALTGALVIEVDGATGDKLMVTGDLNLTGSSLTLTAVGAGFTAASYVVAECTGTLTGLPTAPTGYQVTAVGNTVVLSPAGGYSAWETANGTSQTIDGDHDNDGVSNGVEFFIGGPNDTTGYTPLPGISGTSVTYTKHSGYTGVYGTDFVIETSETLTGAWTQETVGGNVVQSGDSFTYTFPTPLGTKKFVRLKVTGPN